MELEVFRGNDIVAVIKTGGKNARFTHGLMNAHKIAVTDIKQYDALVVQIGDYIIRKGVKYKINTVPDLNADDQLSYNVTFEGPKYTWHDKIFMHEGEADFTFYGNTLLCMQLFITNINDIDPIWVLGIIEDTTEKHLVFSNVTCHEAIIIIAEAFGLEFQEKIKVIDMIPKIGRDTNLTFEYGMGKGLYNLSRTYVSDKNVVTKVYGFGGNRNIPVGYRGAKKRLTFNPGFHVNNIELYGIKEGQYTNDDIIPEREAAVTSATYGNPLSTITDTTLDFNIKDCVIKDVEPKIGFTTGDLAGEEFVITDYNQTTKTITYKSFVNNNNVVLPNATFHAKPGDKYVLFDMSLPSTYVTNAEYQVDADTFAYVLENSVPKVEYGGTIDPIHMRDNQIDPMPGDRVNFKDARIGLDATIRITEISMPLDFPEVISDDTTIDITIANFVTYSAQQRLRDEKLIERHEVKTIDIRGVEQARRNTANFLNLRDSVIDPEGNYYTEKIKPGSIETLFLSVGAKATNFNLNNVSFEANVGGNANSFKATVGQLIHYDLELPGGGFVWEMQPYTVTGLVPANKYYLYAKISKDTNVGSWELSTDVKLAESLAGFYILQAGVLFPVKDGRRDNAITKGMVFIVGDQITAGRIQSIDQSMYIDLTSGRMKVGNDQYGMDWNVTTPNRLTIRGGFTQNAGGISAPITLFRGPYFPTTTYYNGDSVEYNGSKYVYTYPTPIFNVIPTNTAYWTLEISKGDVGTPGTNGTNGANGSSGSAGNYTEFRFAKNGSPTAAPAIDGAVPNPSGWTIAQPTLGAAEYGWITSALKTAAGVLVNNWSTPTRFTGLQGANGNNGAAGAQGPFLNNRGDFDPAKVYSGTAANIQSVKYSGNYYVTRTDAGTIPAGTLPTNVNYFNSYGGQFESVATGLLLATLAYIENLGVRNIKTGETGERFEMTAAGNNLSFFDTLSKMILNIASNSAVQDGTFEVPSALRDVNGNPLWVGTRYDNPTATVFYKYPNYDAGMSVGYGINDSGGFTAIGRKKILTTGSIEASNANGSEKTTITKNGISTTGTISAAGEVQAEGLITVNGGIAASNGDRGVTTNITAGGAKMRFVDGLYVGYW